MMKLRIWRWGGGSGLSRWAHGNRKGLCKRRKWESQRRRRHKAESRAVAVLALKTRKGLRAKEYRWLLESEKGKKTDSP